MAHAAKASSPEIKRRTRTLVGMPPLPPDGARARVIANYEAAVTLLQKGRYEEARTAFDKMLAADPGDLADRIRMNISTCLHQLSSRDTNFQSLGEQYDYAVFLLNDGDLPGAGAHLNAILTKDPAADYAFYGLALLASMTGDSNACLHHLTEAIRHNPKNRIQARADSDFQNMADDPRFTELLYPEA